MRQLASWTGKALSLLGAVCLAAGCAASASGTYVGGDDSGMVSVQMVETSDGHIQGTLSLLLLDASSGQIRSIELPLTGAADRDQLSLQVHRADIPNVGAPLSATLRGNTLTLGGLTSVGPVSAGSLKRSSAAELQRRANDLRSRSQAIVEKNTALALAKEIQRVHVQTLKDVDAVESTIQAFERRLDEYLPKFPSVPARYNVIVQRMEQMLARQRNTRSSFDRGQISFQLSVMADFSGPADTAHGEMLGLERDFNRKQTTIDTSLASVTKACGEASKRDTEVSRACQSLEPVTIKYRDYIARFAAGLASAEQAYQATKAREKAIVREAAALE